MKRTSGTLALLAVLVLAGCASTKTVTVQGGSPSYAVPQCVAILAALPANPPATTKETAEDIVALEKPNIPKGTLLDKLRTEVQRDLANLAIYEDPSAHLAKSNEDVKQLRDYCKPS